jgi:molybdenum cofactor biosynthesis enzyme MoaA
MVRSVRFRTEPRSPIPARIRLREMRRLSEHPEPSQGRSLGIFVHRLNRLVSPRPKMLAALAADILNMRYTTVRVDPVAACNLRCQMCYFSSAEWRTEHAGARLSASELEHIAAQLFPQALQVHFGARMEPTIFPNYPWLVELAKQHSVPFVGFTTNGQLLTYSKLSRMAEAGLDEITLSSHGTRKETFEWLMRRASFERHLETLAIIRNVRWLNPRLGLRINYTVNPDNLDELRQFFDIYGPFGISTLQVRPIYDLGGTEYQKKAVSVGQFQKAARRLLKECRQHGVRLLINVDDPARTRPDYDAHVHARAFLRIVGPGGVWPEDYNWRIESSADYKRRTRWRRGLAVEALRSRRHWTATRSQSAMSSVL